MKKKLKKMILTCLLSITVVANGNIVNPNVIEQKTVQAATIPKYQGKIYVAQNKNKPQFTKKQLSNKKSYEKYGKLDKYGRCTTAISNIGKDLMPKTKRGAIGMVKPTGWHTIKYDCVDGKYLYNRCHLIGYQLTAENANKRNLITGTRSLNVD